MALFQILRGKAANLANKAFHDGYAYLTPDDGAFYIDAETDGVQKRIRINSTTYQQAKEAGYTGTEAEFNASLINIPSAAELSNKQVKITASGLLKGDGAGGVTAAVADKDYIAAATFYSDTEMQTLWDSVT